MYLLFEIILPERWKSARLAIASICSFCSLCYLVWLSVQSKLYAVNGRNLVYFWGMWLWLFILIKKLIFTLLSKVNMNQVKHFLVWLDVNQQQLEIEVIFSYLHVSLRKLPLICVSFWGLREQHYSKLYDFVLLMHVTVSAWCRCPLLFENIWIMNRGRTSKAY